MTKLEVPLESIRSAFQGVIPSPVATASASGEPHSTYLSIVWYLDEERIALSIQFMGTTLVNMRENPQVVMRVVDPDTITEYEIRAVHLRSETSGPTFEVMRTQLGAIAEQSGVRMPSFFGYLFRYALVFLLPTFIIVSFILPKAPPAELPAGVETPAAHVETVPPAPHETDH